MNFSSRLDYLSQFSNAVLSQTEEVKVCHYKVGPRKGEPFVLPLTNLEISQRQQWCENQIEWLKENESTAVMSFLIKEHSE